jgi:hypothetical protein
MSTVSAHVEKAGFPTVNIVAPQFAEMVKTAAQGQGLPALAKAIIPVEVMWHQVEDVRPSCEKAVEEIMDGFTKWEPEAFPETETQGDQFVFEGVDYNDAVNKMESVFLANMWSDGLPLIPPTKESVDWMLTGTDLPREQVITNKISPRYGAITVENVAVNAVMAGARPEYLPVILAAVHLLATEQGLQLSYLIQESVSISGPMFLVNGPIAKELNINSSFGVMGPGWKANAAIGRALSLVLINGGGGNAGPAGTRRVQSLGSRYTCCFAENEAENPWSPLHVENGYAADTSTIAIMIIRGSHLVHVVNGTEEILRATVRALQGFTYHDIGIPWDQYLILAPDHAHRLAKGGWTKESIRKYIHERARMTLAEAEPAGIYFRFGKELLKQLPRPIDRNIPIPVTDTPENLQIIVAGGTGNGTSSLFPGQRTKAMVEIDKYKPEAWDQLIKQANKELLY